MTTTVAKRLRALPSRVTGRPTTKQPNTVLQLSKPLRAPKGTSHGKTTTQTSRHVIAHIGKKVLKKGEPAPNNNSSPPRAHVSNIGRVMTTNGEVTHVSWMDYPPEPPSTSSVYSDWLLNVLNPTSRGFYENLSAEICRNLDYRLR